MIGMDKSEVLNDYSASVFTVKDSSCTAQASENKGGEYQRGDLPSVNKSQVPDHLKNLKVHKLMGLNEIH